MFGRYQALDRLTDWSIQTFRSVPPISRIPLAMLCFSIGDTPAIVLISLAGCRGERCVRELHGRGQTTNRFSPEMRSRAL